MAIASIQLLKNGEPLIGAKVTLGETINTEFTTDENGRVSKTVAADWGPIATVIHIETDGITFGGGPFKIKRDEELTIGV